MHVKSHERCSKLIAYEQSTCAIDLAIQFDNSAKYSDVTITVCPAGFACTGEAA